MLIEKIKADQLEARKVGNKAKATSLTTLIGEAEMIGKNDGNRITKDDEVNKVIVKFIKGIDETISLISDEVKKAELLVEKETLSVYLPKQLSSDELKSIIVELISALSEKNPKMMGKIMADLKAAHDGTYDGKLASQLVKTLLS